MHTTDDRLQWTGSLSDVNASGQHAILHHCDVADRNDGHIGTHRPPHTVSNAATT